MFADEEFATKHLFGLLASPDSLAPLAPAVNNIKLHSNNSSQWMKWLFYSARMATPTSSEIINTTIDNY